MTLRDPHIAEEALLLYADGELVGREAAQVRMHIESCEPCLNHLRALNSVLPEATVAYLQARTANDAAGPRALLRARLAEESRRNSRGSGWYPAALRGFAYACVLALLAATAVLAVRKVSHSTAAGSVGKLPALLPVLPDHAFTPGSTRPVTLAEVCSIDHDDVVREVPEPLQQKVLAEYGIRNARSSDFEVDYLITPGLGGSEDVRNLWPEPHANATWNSYVKDQLEARMHQMVCTHQLSLQDAQREIATDWIAAYKKHFHTDQPMASATNQPPDELPHARFALRRKQLSA